MTSARKLGQYTLLTALVLVINVFCLVKCVHDRHPAVHHTSHNTLPHAAQRGATRSRARALDQASSSDQANASIAPKLKVNLGSSGALALPSFALAHFAPNFISAPLAEQPVLSLGSAARAPGAPRGPPTRS